MLLAEFPLRQDVTYKTALDMPRETGVDFQVHLKDLSFSKVSSTKPVTYLTTSISLVDQYLSHGFLCSGSEAPVLLWDGPKASGSNTNGWVSYVKGMARCSSLLFLAHFTMSQRWNLTVLHPSLYSSMTSITCRLGTTQTDLQAIAIANAQISARGGIRRAHDCFTWLGKLLLLKGQGYSADEVLKKWNEVAANENKLSGQKHQALKFLLSLTQEAIDVLMEHASKYGGSGAFQEESFGNKKIHPGSAPRGDKLWSDRLRITDEGLVLALKAICTMYDQKMPETRCKINRATFEGYVFEAQLVVSVRRQMVEEMGIPPEAADSILQQFEAGDNHLKLELESAIQEKAKSWNPASMALVEKIVKQHRADSETLMVVEVANRNLAAAQLEKEELDLLCKQITHLCYFHGVRAFFFKSY